jgi:hypothetical protein
MQRVTALAALLLGAPALVAAQAAVQPESPARVDARLWAEAAAYAWRFVDAQHQSATGLVNSVVGYPYATIWDIGSTIAAYYAGHELGLLARAEYDERMTRLLGTLQRAELFDGGAFNKNYRTRTGAAAGRNDREDDRGARPYGWSATDLGRLLVWLRIVADAHPAHRPAAEAVVARLDLSRLVRDGYLHGEDIGSSGVRRRYQEGRAGYEQYAASGFALWGARAEQALELAANTQPITVLGVQLLADHRGDAHMTSEPFIMMGLELGWTPDMRAQAWRMLEAQRRRYERTGTMTIVSEDAMPVAPHYFYYYTIHEDGADFAVRAMTVQRNLDGPRWVSTKGAFGWHALLPSEYTRRAVDFVAPARADYGWGSGVFESNGRSTGSQNINTAAVVLTAALYVRTGRPAIDAARDGGGAPGNSSGGR